MRLDPVILVNELIKVHGLKNSDAAMGVAICKAESNMITDRVGVADPDDAGLWQINIREHPEVTREQANDWVWATAWAVQHRGDAWAPWNVVRNGQWKQHHQLGWVSVRLFHALKNAEDAQFVLSRVKSILSQVEEYFDEPIE